MPDDPFADLMAALDRVALIDEIAALRARLAAGAIPYNRPALDALDSWADELRGRKHDDPTGRPAAP